MATKNSVNNLHSCLEGILSKENLTNISAEIAGNNEKGGGYVAEIIFVTVRGIDTNGSEKKYNLVVKCSSSSTILIEKSPELLLTCVHEGNMYDFFFPKFTEFEMNRKIETPFESVPKCYGVFNSDARNMIVLENLKSIGYDVWNQKQPLTRKHIDLVIREYAKFHAISVAMQAQEPEKFEELSKMIPNLFDMILKNTSFVEVTEETVEELYHLLENDLEAGTLKNWLKLKSQVRYVFTDLRSNVDSVKVITHGDCWNNNFMFKYEDEEKRKVSKVLILDWQLASLSPPIFDISHFLFSCSSKEDLEDIDTILRNYHSSFISHSSKLGTNIEATYPFEKFLCDWKKYAKHGLMMGILPLKLGFVDKDKIPDMAKSVESGGDAISSFSLDINDKIGCKNRFLPIVKLVVESGLV